MSELKILKLPEDRTEWTEVFQRSTSREVFAHPGYVSLFAGSDTAFCAVYRSAERELMYPGLLRDLYALSLGTAEAGVEFDIVAPPYGYGGPFAVTGDIVPSAGEFFEAFREWARSVGVVSEYTAFSPKQAAGVYPGETHVKAPCVVRSLVESLDEIWMDYRSSLRRGVKAGQRNGVEVTVDLDGSRSSEFLGIYEHTMDRRGAASSYILDQHFLDALSHAIPGHFAFFFAEVAGRPVSTELVLLSGDSSFFFRGGTIESELPTRANLVLKHEIVSWSKSRGLGYYILGSGNSPDDSLTRFKRLFAPKSDHVLRVGNWVIDPPRYGRLVQARHALEARRGGAWQPRAGFFPAYRAPSETTSG